MTRPTVQQLLPKLAPAQLLFIERRGCISWAIRRITGSRWSHVVLMDQTRSGIAITLEAADLQGVKALRLERYLEDLGVTGLRLRDSTVVTPEDRAKIMEAAWLQVGKGYDVPQMLGMWARRRLAWLFGRHPLKRNRLDGKGRYVCSELASLAYEVGAGIRLAPPDVALGQVDPGMLAETAKLVTIFEWSAR